MTEQCENENTAFPLFDAERIEAAVREILVGIGEDPDREGLVKTPARVARMYKELLSGMREDSHQYLKTQFAEDKHDEMVLVKDIPFSSLCEHHLLPFVGKAHIAYIPNGKVTGLSKIARVVESFSHRLQLQERLTTQIADAFVDDLHVRGVLVVLEAEHMCMTIRGIKKPGAVTVTSAVRGTLRSDSRTREEALSLIRM